MPQLALMTWVYKHLSFEEALEKAAGTGFRHVSFGLPHEGKPAFDDTKPGEAERVLKLLDKYGVKPVTLISTDVLSPLQPMERALSRLDFAKALGVEELLSLGTWGYRTFPTEPFRSGEMEETNAEFAAKYRLVGEEAGRRGLIVTLKPHTGNTATGRVLVETLQAINSPSVKASYDPGNVRYYEGIDPAPDLQVIAGQVVSIVAKDHRGTRAEADFPIPGEGDINFPAIFATLKKVGFDGPVIVERLDGRGEPCSDEELDKRVATSFRNLTRMLADA